MSHYHPFVLATDRRTHVRIQFIFLFSACHTKKKTAENWLLSAGCSNLDIQNHRERNAPFMCFTYFQKNMLISILQRKYFESVCVLMINSYSQGNELVKQ